MELGAFSVSLKVKDLQASIAFYQKLGFKYKSGDEKQKWVVLKNGSAVIGLFQDIIEENYLTFNPGWNGDAADMETFTDIRDIQKSLKLNRVVLEREADEATRGPEYIFLRDPDGNRILIDQHR